MLYAKGCFDNLAENLYDLTKRFAPASPLRSVGRANAKDFT